MSQISSKESIQEQQYDFPYHMIPRSEKGIWKVYRELFWGYEYLANLQVIVNLVMSYSPQNILDFGCGEGRLLWELSQREIQELVGLDISKRATAFANGMALGTDANIKIFNDFQELPHQKYSIITAMEVIEHIPPEKTNHILQELYNILEDNGVLIVSVPTKNIPLNKKHYRHFNLEDLEREVGSLFRIEKKLYIHKVGVWDEIIRRLVDNKYFIPTWEPWLKLTTSLYKRFVMNANEFNGAHLIAGLRKIDKENSNK